MRHRRIGLFSALVAIGGVIGCQAILGIDSTSFSNGESDASNGDGGGSDASDGAVDSPTGSDAGTEVSIAFSPARLFIRQGASSDVAVTIVRNGFVGAVTLDLAAVADAGITATGGPDAGAGAAGLGVPKLTIPAGSTTGTLHVSADSSAPQGATALDFTMSADTVTKQTIATLVAGAPGTTDTSFGIGGAATGPLGGTANSVAVAEDDSFYVGGTTGSGWIVQHYFDNGAHDTAFDTTMHTNLAAVGGTVYRVAVRGTALVFGGTDGNGAFAAQKYTTAGLIDSSFGAAGTFSSTRPSGGYYAGKLTGLAFTSTGAILLAGSVNNPGTNDGYAYLVDTSVHTYSYATLVTPCAIHVDTNGHIVVGGSMNFADGGTSYFVQKLDTAFADAGTGTNGDPSRTLVLGNMVVSPDQQLVFAALNEYVFGGAFASFDQNTLAPGLLTYLAHGSSNDNGLDSVAAQADGRLLFTGNNGGQQLNTFVRRYEADGGVDTSFGTAGSFNVPEVGMAGDIHAFYDVAVDSWGRIIVVGNDGNVGFYVTRLWP